MSSHKEVVINTIEELVQYASQQRSNASRFSLEERNIGDKNYQKYLSETGRGWSYSPSLILSDDLAEQIDTIWTKKQPYRNASYMRNYGSLSLQGILKRLGKSDAAADIAKKIKEAEAAEKAATEKRIRNNTRRQIRETSQKLYELLTSKDIGIDWETHDDGIDLKFFARLSKLTKLLDEE